MLRITTAVTNYLPRLAVGPPRIAEARRGKSGEYLQILRIYSYRYGGGESYLQGVEL